MTPYLRRLQDWATPELNSNFNVEYQKTHQTYARTGFSQVSQYICD